MFSVGSSCGFILGLLDAELLLFGKRLLLAHKNQLFKIQFLAK
jgi:hypothetical protein